MKNDDAVDLTHRSDWFAGKPRSNRLHMFLPLLTLRRNPQHFFKGRQPGGDFLGAG